MTDFSLSGGSVLVTGAGSGIGAAIAYEVAMAGARVVVNDLVAERAEETCAYIVGRGGTADAVGGDVSTLAGARAVVDRAVTTMGGLTGLCNNVGIVKGGPLESLSEEDWKRVFEVDLDTAFYCSQVALPALRATSGVIVNTSSLVAFHPAPFAGAYNAAKRLSKRRRHARSAVASNPESRTVSNGASSNATRSRRDSHCATIAACTR